MIAFNRLLDVANKQFSVIKKAYRKSHYTQLIIGEMHYLPLVQRELLQGLISLKESFSDLRLVGYEGSLRGIEKSASKKENLLISTHQLMTLRLTHIIRAINQLLLFF